MTQKQALLLAIALSISALIGLSGETSATRISGANIKYEIITGHPPAVWSGGALITADAYASASPVITARDPKGKVLLSIALSIPHADLVGLDGVARGRDGTVVVSGYSTDDDGRVARFLAFVGPGDGRVRIVRVNPFHPRQIVAADDGTVWAVGNRVRKDPSAAADPSNGVLRHYGSDGKFLGSFVPQKDIDDITRVTNGNIAVSKDRVGWLSWGTSAGKVTGGRYVEFLLVDGSEHRYPVPRAEFLDGPCGLSGSSEAVVNVVTDRGSEPGHVRQSSLMILDRAKSDWTPLPLADSGSPTNLRFVGLSGETLALWDVKSKLISFFLLR